MPDPTPTAGRQPGRITGNLRTLIRTRLTAGLFTILPIVLTIWLVSIIFYWLRDSSLWLIEAFLLSPIGQGALEQWDVKRADLMAQGIKALPVNVRWVVSIASVFLTFFLLYVVGLVAANVLGRRLIGLVERVVDRLPIIKTIYRTLKQVLDLFGGTQTRNFQRVALVPFPNEVTRSVAFMTNIFRDRVTGEELCCVFLPTTPNPTTGYVFVLKRSDVMEVPWGVEDAIKMIMSGGILAPNGVSMLTGKPYAAEKLGKDVPESAKPTPPAAV